MRLDPNFEHRLGLPAATAWRLSALLTAVLLCGGAWWDGIGMTPDEFEHRGFKEKADELDRATRSMSADALMARCRLLVDAGLADGTEKEAAGRRHDWVICVAALRRVGESRDERWLPVLDELEPVWRRAVRQREIDRGAPFVPDLLSVEGARAYQEIAVADLDPAIVVNTFLDMIVENPGVNMRGNRTARSVAYGLTVRELFDSGVWLPEMEALFVHPSPWVRHRAINMAKLEWVSPQAHASMIGLLADPDERLRRSAHRYLNTHPRLGVAIVPEYLKFLSRDDLDAEARALGEAGLEIRGYVAVSGPRGLRAEPIDGQGEAIEMAD
jgi:hypothetical protein